MKKLAVTAMAALILVGCSSSQHISSRGNDRTSYEQLGAVYKGRTFMRMPLTPVGMVENQSAVVNQGDFLTQLSIISSTSPRLSAKY